MFSSIIFAGVIQINSFVVLGGGCSASCLFNTTRNPLLFCRFSVLVLHGIIELVFDCGFRCVFWYVSQKNNTWKCFWSAQHPSLFFCDCIYFQKNNFGCTRLISFCWFCMHQNETALDKTALSHGVMYCSALQPDAMRLKKWKWQPLDVNKSFQFLHAPKTDDIVPETYSCIICMSINLRKLLVSNRMRVDQHRSCANVGVTLHTQKIMLTSFSCRIQHCVADPNSKTSD